MKLDAAELLGAALRTPDLVMRGRVIAALKGDWLTSYLRDRLSDGKTMDEVLKRTNATVGCYSLLARRERERVRREP